MASRKRMSPGRDKKVFKSTYNKTKRINHSTGNANGGIRL